MDAYDSSASSLRASWFVRIARQAGHVLSEMHKANKLASRLILSYGLVEPDRAPDTYAEFLLRSRNAMRHEPSARRRAAGRGVK
jgi:hypothetical protein